MCFEGRQARPTELINLHSLLQTCTDLQHKLADLLSDSGPCYFFSVDLFTGQH